jgi:hypothetical protein
MYISLLNSPISDIDFWIVRAASKKKILGRNLKMKYMQSQKPENFS